MTRGGYNVQFPGMALSGTTMKISQKEKSSTGKSELVSNLVVDMHGHWIPNVDDGVQTIDQALDVLLGLQKLGYKKAIATPHINAFYNNDTSDLNYAFYTLVEKVIESELEIHLEFSAEYLLDFTFEYHLQNGNLLPISDKYLLIELPLTHVHPATNDYLLEIKYLGYTPILAHPERYLYLNALYKLEKLKHFGCSFQLNLLSICNVYGKKIRKNAQSILGQGWYEFAGSDVHRPSQLVPLQTLKLSYKFINDSLS